MSTNTDKNERWLVSDDGWLLWGPDEGEVGLGPLAIAKGAGFADEEEDGAWDAIEALVDIVESRDHLIWLRDLIKGSIEALPTEDPEDTLGDTAYTSGMATAYRQILMVIEIPGEDS